ncbi:MAG: hypothetical protein RLY93_15580 [Sumerlaeia bacterium]
MKVLAIAVNTFKEAVRNRILYVLLFFAVLVLLGAWVASTLSIFGKEKIIRDLGVAAINVIAVLIAVFVGVGQIYNDLDKKTIYTIVSKPISRWQFLLGKYLGLMLTIAVNVLIMTFFFLAVLYFRHFISDEVISQAMGVAMGEAAGGGSILLYYIVSFLKSVFMAIGTILSLGLYNTDATVGIMGASLLTILELCVITAFAILFSSFSSPTLSAFLTLTAFIIGRANRDIYYFGELLVSRARGFENLEAGQVMAFYLSRAAAFLTPNLDRFNKRDLVAEMQAIPFDPLAVLYGLGYAAVVLMVAMVIFNRRNFK